MGTHEPKLTEPMLETRAHDVDLIRYFLSGFRDLARPSSNWYCFRKSCKIIFSERILFVCHPKKVQSQKMFLSKVVRHECPFWILSF